VDDLALQIGQGNVIVVDDAERADAGSGQIHQRRRAQSAGADHQTRACLSFCWPGPPTSASTMWRA
jgi:hypothetical protein